MKIIRREPTHAEPTNTQPSPALTDLEQDMDFQALSEAAKKWLRQHGLEGFLMIMEAPPHREADKIVKNIDTELITEEAIRALTGLPEGGIFNIDNEVAQKIFWRILSGQQGVPDTGW